MAPLPDGADRGAEWRRWLRLPLGWLFALVGLLLSGNPLDLR